MSLKKWVRDNFSDLELLTLITDEYVPGTIIDRDDDEVHSHSEEMLADIGLDLDFTTVRRPALLASRSFDEKVNRGVKIGILNLGTFTLSDNRQVVASISAQNVVQNRFANLTRVNHQTAYRILRQRDRDRFRLVDEKLVIIETFAATKLTVSFSANGQTVVGVEAEALLKPIDSVRVEFASDLKDTLVIEGDGSLPFGFRAFKI